jgi:hypothetical protein
MFLTSLLFMALLQEPAPQQPAPEQPAPEQPETQQPGADLPEQHPPADQEPKTISQEEIEAKVAQVSNTFAEADRSLTQSVDSPKEKLAEAVAMAARLVVEMEELLAALPSPPPPPPSDNSDGNEKAEDQPKPRPKPEDGEQQMTPLRDMPLSEFLRDPRDDSWGKLPPRLQQTIDSASAEEVPLRYRRWLVEYHRQGVKSGK